MQSNKPTRKHQREVQKAPENLILMQPFKFVGQLPMQECIDRFKYISKEGAYIGMVTANKVRFNWWQRGSKSGGKAWAKGCIEETESCTYISGVTGIAVQDFFAFSLIFVILPLIIGMAQPMLFTVMAVIALGAVAMMLFTLRESNRHTRSMLLWDMQGMFEAKRHQPQHIAVSHQNLFNLGGDPPKKLLLRKKFAFVIHLPLQECIFRLEKATGHKIALSHLSENQAQFTTYEHQSRSVNIWALGYLEATTDTSTCVSGITGVNPVEVMLEILVPGSMLSILIVVRQYPLAAAGVIFGFISILMVFVQMVTIFFGREILMDKLRSIETTEKPK